jgi:Fic family protein
MRPTPQQQFSSPFSSGSSDHHLNSAGRRSRRLREKPNRQRVEMFMQKSLSEKDQPDEKFLCCLNDLVLGGSGIGSPYRTTDVVVRWRRKIVHRPPGAGSVPLLMKDALDLVSAARDELSVDACARIYLSLMKIHPFRQGNGRTARAFVTYLLLRHGFRLRRGSSMEKYFDTNIEVYNERLTSSSLTDPRPWLLFFREAIETSFHGPVRPSRRDRMAAMMRRVLNSAAHFRTKKVLS